MTYTFIERENIKSKVPTCITVNEVFELFQNNDDEILYVVDGNALMAIITPGDLYRYLIFDRDSYINTKFSYVENVDFQMADMIFSEIPTLHQVPVIVDGNYIGVIDNGGKKDKTEWNSIRRGHLTNLDNREKLPIYVEQLLKIKEFCKIHNIQLFSWGYPSLESLHLNQEEKSRYNQKTEYDDGIESLLNMPEQEKKEFFKEDYNIDKINRFSHDYNELSLHMVNGVPIIDDLESGNFNIRHGYRKVGNAPNQYEHLIHLIGPCDVFGVYNFEDRTMAYYLQELINDKHLSYSVSVFASLGGEDFGKIFYDNYTDGDILIFRAYSNVNSMASKICHIKNIDFTEAFSSVDNLVGNFFNSISHHNHIVNKAMAECIFNELDLEHNDNCITSKERYSIQNYYVSPDIYLYYKKIWGMYHDIKENHQNIQKGCIVMNCNPFTYGHRYLIEKAMGQVDILYIFVVEEDKSEYPFKNRFEMVKKGTSDLHGIYVIPSGNYIISKDTFSQYFDKEKEIAEIADMEYDVRIFCEAVSKAFGITKRFAGTEPFDKVTSKYNDTMARILPEYGIDFIEIPRYETDGEAISASKVRRLIKDGNTEELDKLVPETTRMLLR